MKGATEFTAGLAEDFQALDGDATAWDRPMRAGAFERFEQLGLPDSRSEAWRFTSLRALTARKFLPARPTGKAIEPLLPDQITPHRLVFVDGELSTELSSLDSLPDGVRVLDMQSALRDEEPLLRAHLEATRGSDESFVALNSALFRTGCVVELSEGVSLDAPLLLSFRSGGDGAMHSRIILRGSTRSGATVLEEHVSTGASFHNVVVDLELGEDAQWRHVRLQNESREARHLSHWTARVHGRAQLAAYSFVLGGSLVRNDMELKLLGEEAVGELHGLVVAADRQLVDHHTRIEHAVAHTTSVERFRHVLDGQARGVFAGRVDVAQDAQKTDADQSNHNLLLGDGALMNTMPQLEIHADDVKCTHGATLGRLDENALFYLRARGIDTETARSLLIRAFVEEQVEALPLPELRGAVRRQLNRRLPGTSSMEEVA